MIRRSSKSWRSSGASHAWSGRIGVACVLLALSGCGASRVHHDPLADVSWSYADDAVIFEITADARLNQYEGQAHTLLLGAYESTEPQAFRDLVADSPALANTLASGRAPATFLQFARYVVVPGQHTYWVLERAQKARWVGLVAAYAQPGAAHAVRQFETPVRVQTHGFLFKTRTLLPDVLVVRLNLGPQSILNAEVLPSTPHDLDLQRAHLLEGGGKEIRLDPLSVPTEMRVN